VLSLLGDIGVGGTREVRRCVTGGDTSGCNSVGQAFVSIGYALSDIVQWSRPPFNPASQTAQLKSSVSASIDFTNPAVPSVRLSVDSSVNNGTWSHTARAGVSAKIEDTLRVLTGPDTGFIELVLGLSGGLYYPTGQTYQNEGNASFEIKRPAATKFVADQSRGTVNLSTSYQLLIPYTGLGSTVPLYVEFVLGANCLPTTGGYFGANCTATGNFGQTITFDSLRVLDANHQPITNATIMAESGFDYSRLGTLTTPVPEPGTWVMVTVTIIIVGMLRSWKYLGLRVTSR
jgi:hypothetical protein